MAYEEQLLDRRYWQELRSVGGRVEGLKSACDNLLKSKDSAEAELAKVKEDAAADLAKLKEDAAADLAKLKEDAGRLVEEAEAKAKAAVASETARLQAEFDKKLAKCLSKAKEEAVLAYRQDRGRAVEQATTYVQGGKYILEKIKGAFPDQDWSVLPEPALTDDLVDDEHQIILEGIEQSTGGL